MRFGDVYTNPSSFLLICKRLINNKMQCVIVGENLRIFSPAKFTSDIKTSKKLYSYFFSENIIMKNQESSANMKVPFDMTEIIANDINMEDIVVTSTQSSDIAEKTISMNKSQITTLALNLLNIDSHIHSSRIYISEIKPYILYK